jgi:nicotinate-nucleotide pyrophosphorylase (carboxylating)
MTRAYTSPVSELRTEDISTLVKLALSEDCIDHDITSESIFSIKEKAKARIFAKEFGILCGSKIAEELNNQTNQQIIFEFHKQDGDIFNPNETILSLEGNLVTLLKIERPLLNFLQYLSGISTETYKIAKKYEGRLFIFDTRKTLPAYRTLAKYAVYTGGGYNHRLNLSDMALIKDNHVALSGSISNAVKKIRDKFPDRKLELEIDGLSQLEEAISSKPDIILLDNFSIQDTMIAVKKIRENSNIQIECSGGITPDKLDELAKIGLIGVSMGYLTHTTRFLDLSLEILN